MKPAGLDGWRNYFRTANSDIFGIIENAIKVAASDCPKEFRVRRDRIAETLFSCKLTRCSSCARVEGEVGGRGGFNTGFDGDGCELEAGGSKESKVNSSRDDRGGEMNTNQLVSNYSYGEAEALTDEIEEQGQIVAEVLRIKQLLYNFEDETDSVLFENLRRLQLMLLTVDILKTTEIGKAVNGLRKHGSKNIRNLARTLIDVWKDLVDEWVNASAAIAEGTPDSVNPSVVDEEEGLPSPPMDDFFATQPTSMELSQFFDGMDDDGNPRNSGDFTNSRDNGRRQPVEKPNVPKRKPEPDNEVNVLSKNNKGQLMKKQEASVRTNKPPSNTQSGPGRPQKPGVEYNAKYEAKYQKKEEKVNIQKRSLAGQQDLKHANDDAVEVKLEATKRKLQESYHQAENAKKQRTIQVMELRDLPKQGPPKPVLGQRNPHTRPGNHNRHWANARR